MKATAMLKKQHKQVIAILKKLESGRSEAEPLLRELCDSLAAHMTIEQELFYPAVRELKEPVIAEAFEEHAIAELALKRVLAAAESDRKLFKARVTTLRELLKHHIEEEEEELFPVVEKKMDAERLGALGREMKARFDEALEQGFEALVPKSMSATSADVSQGRGAGTHKGSRAARNGRASSMHADS